MGETITIRKVSPLQAGRLELASPAIGPDGRIGDLYSAYHDNVSPALEWTGMPDAETFVLIVEDPDAPMDKPFVHWLAWNIPGTRNGLPRGVRHGQRLSELGGMVQGRNGVGAFGYMGPKPPPGHGVHRYHFQLFALDRAPELEAGAPLEAIVQVLKAEAIASAELVGTYERPADGPQPGEARSFKGPRDRRGGLDADDADSHAPHDPDGTVRPER